MRKYAEMTEYNAEMNILAQIDITLKAAGLPTRAVNKCKQIVRGAVHVELEAAYCVGFVDGAKGVDVTE